MKRRLATLSGALLALGGALSVTSNAHAQTRQFEGWVTGCDNALVCTAIAFAEPAKIAAEPGIPFLQIRHSPLRDATPEIRLFDPGLTDEVGRLARLGASLVASPVGAEIAKGPETFRAEYDGKGGFRFKDEQARSILFALRSGHGIRISIGQKQSLRLLTAGLDGALGYFDDQQELADTPGALVKKPKGDLIDYAHPPPPDVDTIELSAFGEPVHSDAAQRGLPAVARCKPAPSEQALQAYPLRGSATLLRRTCDADGINEMSAWYVVAKTGARPVPYGWNNGVDDKRRDGALLANAEVLPNGGLIRAVRFRGPTKDCGIAERWGWSKEGKFLLVERREMPLCRSAGQAHWIITYRADAVSPN